MDTIRNIGGTVEPNCFRLLCPPRTQGDLLSGEDLFILSIPGKTLQRYLQDYNMMGRRLQCRLLLGKQRLPIRMSYIPRPGDVIRMVRTRALS